MLYTSMCIDVYDGGMSRTNIDIDDELIERAMQRYGFRTKRETVDFALRAVAGKPFTSEEFLALEGTGWGGDLEAIKSNPVREW
jgi:Arc/MetJ family transcription regulator